MAKNASKKVAKKSADKRAAEKKPVSPAKAARPEKSSRPVKPENAEEKTVKRVPPRIIRKAPVIAKAAPQEYREIDTAKAVAFAMSIAEEMKRSAAQIEIEKAKDEIKLSRRPTTRTQGKMTEKFPVADLKEFRKRLIEAREKALSGADAMRATGFNESEDHEADGGDGTNQTLRLQALGQMGNINRTIQQIEEALHRIDDGTYGVCTSCGQLIRKPRLMNQPFVLTCMECQNEMERLRR
jgi:RNA polymerase-binding transcription factor DksA